MVRTRGMVDRDEIHEPVGRARVRGRARGRGAISSGARTPVAGQRRARLLSPRHQPEIFSSSGLREYSEGSRDRIGMQPVVARFSHGQEIPGLRGVPFSVVGSSMTSEDRRLFGEFSRMDPPRFYGTSSEDAYEFVMRMYESLFMMGIVESHGVAFASYQLSGDARIWWRDFLGRRPIDSPPLTWDQFCEAFSEQYFSFPILDQKRYEFQHLKQQGMSVAEYTARFRSLARFAAGMVPTEEERVRKFMYGLDFPILEGCLAYTDDHTSFQTAVGLATRREQILGQTRVRTRGRRPRGQGRLREQVSVGFRSRFSGRGEPTGFSASVPPVGRSRRCYHCRGAGHRARECPEWGQDISVQTSRVPTFPTDRGDSSSTGRAL